MEEGGLAGCVFDPCVYKTTKTREWLFEKLGKHAEHAEFVKSDPIATETMMVGSWVDDLTEVGSSNLILDWFIWHLRQRFTINEKSTGECEYMLSARIVRDRKKGFLMSDLPQTIVDMTLSSDAVETPENQTVEKEDCKPTFEGLPEFEGSPSPDDSDGSKGRIMEYACLRRVGLGREFYDMMVQAAEED